MPNLRRSSFLQIAAAAAGSALAAPPLSAQNPAAPELDSQRFRRAAVAGDLAIVTRLLDQDPALLYSRDAHGISVFILASLAGQKAVAAELQKRGLVLDVFEAVTVADRTRVAELSKESPGFARMRAADGRTPLHYACAAGQGNMIQFLSTAGADLSAGPGCPLADLLKYAAEMAAMDSAQVLLGNGANPNGVATDGTPVLQLAVQRGLKPTVEVLLRKGATPTPAAIALAGNIQRDYYGGRVAKPLPKTDIPQEWINTYAIVAHADLDQVKRLSKLCPELALTRSSFDEMAVEAGAHMGRNDIVDHLLALGAPVSTCTATMMGSAKAVRELLSADPQRIRERGAHDFPLLFYTAFGKELPDVAEVLLAAGADVNVNMLGATTLHQCAQRGHVQLAEVLIAKGADVNHKSLRNGATPLAIARNAKQEKMIALLTARGAM